jgi:hypothetical protein
MRTHYAGAADRVRTERPDMPRPLGRADERSEDEHARYALAMPTPRKRPSEEEYLRLIERLAHEVVEVAAREDWLTFGEDGQADPEPIRRAVNALATELQFVHHEGDGCVDSE